MDGIAIKICGTKGPFKFGTLRKYPNLVTSCKSNHEITPSNAIVKYKITSSNATVKCEITFPNATAVKYVVNFPNAIELLSCRCLTQAGCLNIFLEMGPYTPAYENFIIFIRHCLIRCATFVKNIHSVTNAQQSLIASPCLRY